jgi:hypothetical protein
MDTMSWPGRPDPIDSFGFDEEESDSETDYKKSSRYFEDDIVSESDNDIDIDASHILGEEMSSEDDGSSGGDRSIDEGEKEDKSNYVESDGGQTEQDSVSGSSFGQRIDPSAHEPSRYDDKYRRKPDPYDEDDKPDPFNKEKKEDPYNQESIGSNSGEDLENYDDMYHDVENPSFSYRSFGSANKDNDEISSERFDKEGSSAGIPSMTESRGESGIEVEEIVEFDSVSKKKGDPDRDGFDDEPKEESNETVKTSRERRIITFLSGFVCCLILLLIISIAVGIGLGVNRNKESQTPQPVPVRPPPSSAPTLETTTLAPIPVPTEVPDTSSPTNIPTEVTSAPVDTPVAEPATPTTDEPSPIDIPPDSPENSTPSTFMPTRPSSTPPDSQNTELLQFLIANSLDEGEAVLSDATPQNKAYKWLLTNAFLTIYSDEQILTRYGLATFFYATNGPTTWDSFIRDDGWLTDASECEWGSTANNQCTKGVYTSLTLDFVGVSGTIPRELGLLTALERFSVRGDGMAEIMSGTIPDIFGSLSNMQTIRLNDNDFTGLIPASFASLKNCIVMILSGNSLIGKIPKELAETQARTLNLSHNQLSGQIPSELFTLSELKILNLQNNNLSGTIPNEIGDATSISNINFSNNQLGGSIPSEIGNLVQIRSAINFSSNRLSGGIPSEIGLLNKMSKFLR